MRNIPYMLVLLFPLVGYLNREKLKSIKPEMTFYLYLLLAAFRGNGNGDYFNYISGVSRTQTGARINIGEVKHRVS